MSMRSKASTVRGSLRRGKAVLFSSSTLDNDDDVFRCCDSSWNVPNVDGKERVQNNECIFEQKSMRQEDLAAESMSGRIGQQEKECLSVIFVSTEVAPWSKVGGLGDVVSALPKALSKLGMRVITVAPMYEEYDGTKELLCNVPLDLLHLEDMLDDGYGDENDEQLCDCDKMTSSHYCSDESETNGVSVGAGSRDVFDLMHCVDDSGVQRVFVKHPWLLTKDIYGSSGALTYKEASDVANLDVRYNILCQGALAVGACCGLPEEQEGKKLQGGKNDTGKNKVVFVLNDWPTALLVLRLKYFLQNDEIQKDDFQNIIAWCLKDAKTVFCIHNLAYQGQFSASIFPRLRLPEGALSVLSTPLADDIVEKLQSLKIEVLEHATSAEAGVGGAPTQVNFMQAALMCCNSLVTVSPNYAQEIMADKELSCGMMDILKTRGVYGIMNGIDTDVWNPNSDIYLPQAGRFSYTCAEAGKRHMKRKLQERLGLIVDPHAVLFAFIGRLTEQKGMDVLLQACAMHFPKRKAPEPTRIAIENDAQSPIQLIVLGTGAPWLENAVRGLEASFPGHAIGIIEFSEELAHWILAGSDFALVPSQFEPCGLIAQCAARYGAVPISTATGGLKDLGLQGIGRLVTPLSPLSDTTGRSENTKELMAAIGKAALDCQKGNIKEKVECMQGDYSWHTSALEWKKVLHDLMTT